MGRLRLPPDYEAINAAAAIAGEVLVVCSCCIGSGKAETFFGFRTCDQCKGSGFDVIGPATLMFIKEMRGTK